MSDHYFIEEEQTNQA